MSGVEVLSRESDRARKRYATGHVPLAPSGVRGHPGGLRAHGGPARDALSMAFSIGPSGRCASTHRLKSKLPRFSMPRPQRCGVERGGTASSADGTLGRLNGTASSAGGHAGQVSRYRAAASVPSAPRVAPLTSSTATRSTSSVRTAPWREYTMTCIVWTAVFSTSRSEYAGHSPETRCT